MDTVLNTGGPESLSTSATAGNAPPQTAAGRPEWFLKPNCSLSPRQLACAYAVLCAGSFAVALLCALRGAWYVLAFSALEMLAVAAAFFYYARHTTDHDHIALGDGCLLVELVRAGKIQQTRLDAYWAKVALPSHAQGLINLQAKGVQVEVGRFITGPRRRQVARELQQALRRAAQA